MSASSVLLVDLGNGRAKWAWLEPGQSQQPPQLSGLQVGSLADLLRQMAPAELWVSSVAASEQLQQLQQQWPHSLCHVARSSIAAGGVINGYSEPARLGVDRWLALIGARQLCRAPQLVVDAGTALTIDLLDEFGQHKGGWIVPGRQLLLQALTKGTAAVRPQGGAQGEVVAHSFGLDTNAAVSSGCWQMLLGAVRQAQAEAQQLLGSNLRPKLLLCGGDGPALAALLTEPCQLLPDLVLRGLAWLARREMSSGDKPANFLKKQG